MASSQIQSGAYALILAEERGVRRIPIIVGTAEAQSIAIALEHIIPPRPLTHDLLTALIQVFNAVLESVYIYKFEDGVFYSELEINQGGGHLIKLDSRTSDAIAIALRTHCAIYAAPSIVEECGVILEDTTHKSSTSKTRTIDELLSMEPHEIKDAVELRKWLSLQTREDLLKRLEEAIEEENYEDAKMYQDELRGRKPIDDNDM